MSLMFSGGSKSTYSIQPSVSTVTVVSNTRKNLWRIWDYLPRRSLVTYEFSLNTSEVDAINMLHFRVNARCHPVITI
ncbi:MAG: hypothetical protein P8P46_00225, partial [Alphaproteobacteria bacterium]|nr:hypothetical protein [Alphaproteobacteria bacterium]